MKGRQPWGKSFFRVFSMSGDKKGALAHDFHAAEEPALYRVASHSGKQIQSDSRNKPHYGAFADEDSSTALSQSPHSPPVDDVFYESGPFGQYIPHSPAALSSGRNSRVSQRSSRSRSSSSNGRDTLISDQISVTSQRTENNENVFHLDKGPGAPSIEGIYDGAKTRSAGAAPYGSSLEGGKDERSSIGSFSQKASTVCSPRNGTVSHTSRLSFAQNEDDETGGEPSREADEEDPAMSSPWNYNDLLLRIVTTIVAAPLVVSVIWFAPLYLCWLLACLLCILVSFEMSWLSYRICNNALRSLPFLEEELTATSGPAARRAGRLVGVPVGMTAPSQSAPYFAHDLCGVPADLLSPKMIVVIDLISKTTKYKWFKVFLLGLTMAGGGVSVAIFISDKSLCLVNPISLLAFMIYFGTVFSATVMAMSLCPTFRSAVVLLIQVVSFNALAVHSIQCTVGDGCAPTFNPIFISTLTIVGTSLVRLFVKKSPLVVFMFITLDIFSHFYTVILPSLLYHMTDHEPTEEGRQIVIAFLNLIWWSDSGAYLSRETFRRFNYNRNHPISLKISADVDLEGTIVATGFGILGMYVSKQIFGFPGGMVDILAFSIPGVLVGRLGALFESLLKRGAYVKYSSFILPGHGGFLDRCSSLLFVGILLPFLFSSERYNGNMCPA